MGKRYNTFYEMIKNLSSYEFLIKYYLKVGFFKNIQHIDAYQDLFRVYLDEYPEQEELREEYLKKWYYWENIRKKTELWKQKQEIDNIQTENLGPLQVFMNKFLKRN